MALDDISDIDRLARIPDRSQNLVEQLTGPSDKRLAL
jgi:hypothetical protein